MAKKDAWHSLWGPLKVLNNEADVQIEHFSNARLDDLQGCPSIYELRLSRSADTIDLEKISHLVELRHLKIEKCAITNEQAILKLPLLYRISVDDALLTDAQKAFFAALADNELKDNRKRGDQLDDAAEKDFFGDLDAVSGEEQAAHEAEVSKLADAIIAMDGDALDVDINPKVLVTVLLRASFLGRNLAQWTSIFQRLMAKQDQKAFDAVIKAGLLTSNAVASRAFFSVLPEQIERLGPSLCESFGYFKRSPMLGFCDSGFSRGKLKDGHFAIAHALIQTPDPRLTDVFKLFLDDRVNFSNSHLVLYKRLLPVIHHCQCSDLTGSIIDLIEYERVIIGGDPAFIKKCLGAVSKVGHWDQVEHLDHVMREERREVILEQYHGCRSRMMRRKSKA